MILDASGRPIEGPTQTTRTATGLALRSYRAHQADRLASGFGLFPTTPRETIRREIRGLVSHARHAAQNFDHARAYEMLIRRHVIGPNGIRLQMDAREPTGAPDQNANRQIEAAWARWGRRGAPTICGRLSWWGVECQVATAIAREGGALVRIHRGRHRGPFWYQIEPVPFDLLDLDYTTPLRDGGWCESGIEFDQDGRARAFWLWSHAPDEGHRPGTRRRVRVPARDMIHVTVPEEIGQTLGVPRSATALRLMNMSEKYQEAAMTAANYGAAQMVFFEQQDNSGTLSGAPLGDVPIDDIEAGTMAMLPPGVKAVPHSPSYPEAAIEPFMRTMDTSQAAGLGVSYETLTTDLSKANFSSLRAGKAEERDEWRMLQRAVHEGLHDAVFAGFLPSAILSGQLRLPMAKLDKFSAATWRPRGWPSVNPKDDATADAKDLENGTTSRTEIAARRGRTFEDICAERQAEENMMRAYGLDPGTPGAADDGIPGDFEPPQI